MLLKSVKPIYRSRNYTFGLLTRKFLSHMPTPDFSDHNVVREGLRLMTDAVLGQLGLPPPGMTERYHKIPLRDGTSSELKIHKPSQSGGPLIVLCFGGGFVAGDNNQMTPVARALVLLFGATVVNISYRIGPEDKFPQGQLDAIDSVKWIAENAADENLASDPTKGFLIGGSSAGGSLAAALSRYFEEDKLAHPLTGQWLHIPSVMDLESCPEQYKSRYISPVQNADAPMLSKAALDMMATQSGWDMSSDLRCAVLSKTPISKQPRTYFQVSGLVSLICDMRAGLNNSLTQLSICTGSSAR